MLGLIDELDVLRCATHTMEPKQTGRDQVNGWRPESVDQSLPIQYFSINRGINGIPDPSPCPCCGSQTEKTTVPYWVQGRTRVMLNTEAPGYACGDCGAELYDPLTDIELVTSAAAALDPVADLPLRAILFERAASLSRRLIEFYDSPRGNGMPASSPS